MAMRVKFTALLDEPWRHPMFAKRDKEGGWVPGPDGSLPHRKEFRNGDRATLPDGVAEHLIASGQAEKV